MPIDSQKLYTGGFFMLELDGGKPVGLVSSIDGGHLKSDPVVSLIGGHTGKEGGDYLNQKYSGRPKYEDITVTSATALSPSFWQWVRATVDNKPERRDGALVTYDYDKNERFRRTFKRALISEVTFPAVDAAGKGGASLTVKFSPELYESKQSTSGKLTMEEPVGGLAKTKMWTQANFRFSLDNIPADNFKGAKVDAITIKQNVIRNPVGSELVPRIEVGRVELPNIVLSVPEVCAQPLVDWYQKSVVEGKRGTTNGHLSYLDSTFKNTLAELSFFGVGISSIEFEKSEPGKEQVHKVKVTLFMEGLTVKGGAGTA